ncbi:MAG: hypothetical protein ACLPT6_09325 [Desulfobaccales bacterium]
MKLFPLGPVPKVQERLPEGGVTPLQALLDFMRIQQASMTNS